MQLLLSLPHSLEFVLLPVGSQDLETGQPNHLLCVYILLNSFAKHKYRSFQFNNCDILILHRGHREVAGHA